MAKIITIAQQKGGAGKTTLAAHIAIALSQRGNRVAAIDIDPQGSLSYWHNIREERFGEGYTGITFNALSGWRVGSEVARLKKSQDYVIIDSPPHTETEARAAIRSADLIVIPIQPSPTDLWATKATLELAKTERTAVRVVLNRVNPNSKLANVIADELPELAENTIGNRVLFASSLMEGRTATEIAPTSPASREIKKLVKELLLLVQDSEPELKTNKQQKALEEA
ncbi:MAG: ParA family partition ATPase [Rickettsiales bacterium]